MFVAQGLTKIYGKQTALHALDLSVAPGEVFCLLGANGAGKSTTINLFLNFITPSAGTAMVNGIDVVAQPAASKQRPAYIPENVMLYPHLSGRDNLRYFLELSGDYGRTDEELSALLAQVGLQAGPHSQAVATYSKGTRQKVGIALAVARKATSMLLDDPTSGLDPKASNDFTGHVQLLSAAGVAKLIATHDLYHAWECGHRFGIMRSGHLLLTLDKRNTTMS